MPHSTSKILFFSVFTLIVLNLVVVTLPTDAQISKINEEQIRKRIDEVDVTRVLENVITFSSFGTRLTGSAGAEEAAEYIRNKFIEYGLGDVSYYVWPAAVPVDGGGNLTVISPASNLGTIPIYPLWPNLIAPSKTPPGGVTGPLVYVGQGTIEEMNGKPLNGSIVLMDFNSRDRWKDAAKFGANAVIFIEPDDTNWVEANLKCLPDVPFRFPRAYVTKDYANLLLKLLEQNGNVVAHVEMDMVWRRVSSKIVIGYLEGTKEPDKYILMTAHYDSFSIVPSKAPGAEEAIGISTLLELARYYSAHNPSHTLVFIAFSGTDLGNAGSRRFIEEMVANKWDEWGHRVILQFDINLNTYLPALAPSVSDGMGCSSSETAAPWATGISDWFKTKLRPAIEKVLNPPPNPQLQGFAEIGGRYGVYTTAFASSLWGAGWSVYYFYGEPLVPSDNYALGMMGGPGVTWITPVTWKKYVYTPLDTPEKLNLANLEYQLKFLYPAIDIIINYDNLQPELLPKWVPQFAQTQGQVWCDAYVKTAEYNYSTGWYTPIPNAIVAWRKVGFGIHGSWVYEMSDENGTVSFIALQHGYRTGSYTWWSGMVDEKTGNIIYAPNFGANAFRGTLAPTTTTGLITTMYHGINQHGQDLGIITLFNCSSMILFDVLDPHYVNLAPSTVGFEGAEFSINDFRSHSALLDYGFVYQFFSARGRNVVAAFVPHNIPVEIIFKTAYSRTVPLGFLVNASQSFPDGYGYTLNPNEQLVLSSTQMHFVRDMYLTETYRREALVLGGISLGEAKLYNEAVNRLRKAEENLKDNDYSEFESNIQVAWAALLDSYVSTKTSYLDTAGVLPFFGTALIPFAIVLEAVIFQMSGKKKILGIIASYIVPFLILYTLHPSFRVVFNPYLVMVGFAILVFLVPIIALVYMNAQTFIRQLGQKIFGVHVKSLAETVSRGSIASSALTYGLKNMRKRAFRTSLVLVSVIIVTGSMVSFMSLKSLSAVGTQPMEGEGSYNGIMIYHREWGRIDYNFQPGVGERLFNILEKTYSDQAVIVPRAWRTVPNPVRANEIWNENYTRFHFLRALLGVTRDDPVPFQDALASGRWFTKGEENSYVAVIPKSTADDLGITELPSKISIWGLDFTVVGIANDAALYSLMDLNQEPITPLDITMAMTWSQHLQARDIVIIPYETALGLGAWTVSVSMKFHDASSIKQIADSLSKTFYLNVIASVNGSISLFTPVLSYTILGLNVQLPIIVIGAIGILNTILAGVQERKREIETYASVGMSPFTVTFLFIAESIAYAVLGGVIGYMLGMVMSDVAVIFNPTFPLEYGSSKVILAVIGVLVITLAASLYPALIVSKTVTPSLERRWRVPSPVGDQWSIPFPFIAATEKEALGISSYVEEVVEGHRGESPDVFRTLTKQITKKEEEGRKITSLVFDVQLAPYELGVKTRGELAVIQERSGQFTFALSLYREAGSRGHWETHGKTFIDLIRKQLLMWRGLPEEERSKYMLREA